jgi:HTH-type transcriptional regulator, pleiotropic regulator of extracellular virulence genes
MIRKEGVIMRLKGEVVKQVRRKRGLSQTALAEGICTQATISLMEKQNRIPKMNILTALCARLDVPVDQIIENDDISMTAFFDEITLMLVNHDYEGARKRLSRVKVKKLQNDFDKQHYYYLLGMLQVASNQIDEAIFNFELILMQFSTTSANIYLAMTTVGMALAYEKRGDTEKALQFVGRAIHLIDDRQLNGGKRQWIILYHEIADLYYRLGQYRQAISMAGRGIKICREEQTLFLLGSLYMTRGQAQAKLNQSDVARESLMVALSICKIIEDNVAQETVSKELSQLVE